MSRNPSLIAGFDPEAAYSSRLSARSALFTELQLLLSRQERLLKRSEYRSLVLKENLLARSSMAARTKLWEELSSRYILDSGHPIFSAFWCEWRRSASEPEQGLTAYVLFALNDRLVADLGIEWLFPRLKDGPAEVRVADVLAFISSKAQEHPEVEEWSDQTRMAVARKYCTSVRDFGLARGVTKKVTVHPALYAAPVRLLIRALELIGTSLWDLVRHPGFRLLSLDGVVVIDALAELNRRGELRFRMQGDVIELEIREGH